MALRSVLTVLALVAPAIAFTTSTNRLSIQSRTNAPATMTMKLYDWKRREANEDYSVESGIFTVDNLQGAPGAYKAKKRKGRGIAAGQGATCGFGMRGQKSRAGRPTRPGFEGGQIALYRRLPKYVGRPMGPGHKHTNYNLIKLDELNGCEEGATVSFDSLFEAKAITKSKYDIHKVVGGTELTAKKLTVQAHAFTASAREAIEGAGGKCVTLSPTTNLPVESE